MNINTQYSNGFFSNPVMGKKMDSQEAFTTALDDFEEAHKLIPDDIKVEDDWREMSDKEWDKLVEHIDKYLDSAKENIEELKKKQEEAAAKMAAQAPAGMKTILAAEAALQVAANGFSGTGSFETEDTSELEKLSWTYEMDTDDQVILAEAKQANERAADMLTKSQEIAMAGDTTEGLSNMPDVKECASLKEENEEKKTWIITAYTEQGIMCKECTKSGETKDLWSIRYNNPGDYKKVWEFLDRFEKNSSFEFAGNKNFWIDFLSGKISDTELTLTL